MTKYKYNIIAKICLLNSIIQEGGGDRFIPLPLKRINSFYISQWTLFNFFTVGQVMRVKGASGSTFLVTKPFAVPLDNTSVIVVVPYVGKILMMGNEVRPYHGSPNLPHRTTLYLLNPLRPAGF